MRAALLEILLVAGLLTGAPALPGGVAQAASFDCGKAETETEKAICASPELGRLDVLVGKAFASFKPEYGTRRAIAHAVNAGRDACGSDEACIFAAQADALQTYGGELPAWASTRLAEILADRAQSALLGSARQPAPTEVGRCAATTISDLGTRLEGGSLQGEDDGSGSSVAYRNGLGGVSYEREAALVASRVGDKVAICLVGVPRDCPAGDDRGRVYFTLNPRTGQSWQLPDASHSCGGA